MMCSKIPSTNAPKLISQVFFKLSFPFEIFGLKFMKAITYPRAGFLAKAAAQRAMFIEQITFISFITGSNHSLRSTPILPAHLLLNILHALDVFEMLVLRPQSRAIGAGGGKD